MLGLPFSGFLLVMVLLCFCLTDGWSIAGSLESHLNIEFLVDNFGSAGRSSSLELYQKGKASEYQWSSRSPLPGRRKKDKPDAVTLPPITPEQPAMRVQYTLSPARL